MKAMTAEFLKGLAGLFTALLIGGIVLWALYELLVDRHNVIMKCPACGSRYVKRVAGYAGWWECKVCWVCWKE